METLKADALRLALANGRWEEGATVTIRFKHYTINATGVAVTDAGRDSYHRCGGGISILIDQEAMDKFIATRARETLARLIP